MSKSSDPKPPNLPLAGAAEEVLLRVPVVPYVPSLDVDEIPENLSLVYLAYSRSSYNLLGSLSNSQSALDLSLTI